jgi:hypothetical protein
VSAPITDRFCSTDRTTDMLVEHPRHLDPSTYSRATTDFPIKIRKVVESSKRLAESLGQMTNIPTATNPRTGFSNEWPDSYIGASQSNTYDATLGPRASR